MVGATGSLAVDGSPQPLGERRRRMRTPECCGPSRPRRCTASSAAWTTPCCPRPTTAGSGLIGSWLRRRRCCATSASAGAGRQRSLERVGLAGLDRHPRRAVVRAAAAGRDRRVIVGRPRMILLDEPAAGLDSAETEQLAVYMKQLRAEGVSILVVDHKVDFLDRPVPTWWCCSSARSSPRVPPTTVWGDHGGRRLPGEGPQCSRWSASGCSYGPRRSRRRRGAEVDRRRGRRAARPQRGRQDLDAAAVSGLVPSTGGSVRRPVGRRGRVGGHRPRRPVPRPRGPPRLRQASPCTRTSRLAPRPRAPDGHRFGFDDVYDLFPALVPLRRRAGWALSGGEQQMVAIGRALVASPRCCCSTSRRWDWRRSSSTPCSTRCPRCARGSRCWWSSRTPSQALDLCDRAYVLVEGRIVLTVTVPSSRRSPRCSTPTSVAHDLDT